MHMLRLLLIASSMFVADVASTQEDPGFMPKGGKSLLLGVLGENADTDLAAITTTPRSEREWREILAPRRTGLSDVEFRTLLDYIVLNLPLDEKGRLAIAAGQSLASVLPRDGRDLAWEECQSCHSLFSSHLTQDRDVQAWRNLFLSPFHRGMKMTAQEREEFARYSAINMPMSIENVPEDLRY